MSLAEKQIILRIQNGKTEEYSYFLEHYSREVFATVIRLLDNVQDAEEVTQDAFVSAYQHISDYRTEMPFGTWVCHIAYNRAISMLRKRKRIPSQIKMDENRLADISDEMVSDEFYNVQSCKMRLLETALSKISADDRALLYLFYQEDKSLKEIAYILGMDTSSQKSTTALATRIFRIRKKLYVLIKQEETDYER